jgi:hypothetical protein
LILSINGLMTFWIIVFISDIFAMSDILNVNVFVCINLLNFIKLNCVIKNIIDFGRLILNSYIFL